MYIVLFIFSVFIASCAQMLLKSSTNRQHQNYLREYLNFNVVFAYLLLALTMFLAIVAYKGVPLKYGQVLQSTGFIFVLILSRVFFKEKPTADKITGIVFIISGIIIFSL